MIQKVTTVHLRPASYLHLQEAAHEVMDEWESAGQQQPRQQGGAAAAPTGGAAGGAAHDPEYEELLRLAEEDARRAAEQPAEVSTLTASSYHRCAFP